MNRQLLLLLASRDYAATGAGARIRREARLTQSEAAAACHVPPGTLSRWESGKRRPTGRPAMRWAQLLHDLEQHANARSSADINDIDRRRVGASP